MDEKLKQKVANDLSKNDFYCYGHDEMESGRVGYCIAFYRKKTSELKSEVHMLRKRELDRSVREYRIQDRTRKQAKQAQ